MSFATGHSPAGQSSQPSPWASSNPPASSSAPPDHLPVPPAASSAPSMALATPALPLDTRMGPSGFRHPAQMFQGGERVTHPAVGSHRTSHFTQDMMQSRAPWLSEPGVLQVPPRPHSGPSVHSAHQQLHQRAPSFHSVPDTFAHHALNLMSPTQHSPHTPRSPRGGPSGAPRHHSHPSAPPVPSQQPFHPLNPKGYPRTQPPYHPPVRHHSAPERYPPFDHPPFHWDPSSHHAATRNPWPFEQHAMHGNPQNPAPHQPGPPPGGPRTDSNLGPISPPQVGPSRRSSDAGELQDPYQRWGSVAPPDSSSWLAAQAGQDSSHMFPAATGCWRSQAAAAAAPPPHGGPQDTRTGHDMLPQSVHTAPPPISAQQMWQQYTSSGEAQAAPMPPYSEGPSWPTLYPKASNMSCLRRLLESSADSKDAVAAALQHTTPDFSPGLPGLTKLVSLFTKQGKWRKALAIFDVLGKLGLEPDLVITNAALGACARGADTSRLWQLLSDLLAKGQVPDSITYKGAISALAKNGEWQQCVQLFITMCERGLVAEGATCLALISTCGKAGQWQLSEEILLCTISERVASELLMKVGAPDASRMNEGDRELLMRLVNWRQNRDAATPGGAVAAAAAAAPVAAAAAVQPAQGSGPLDTEAVVQQPRVPFTSGGGSRSPSWPSSPPPTSAELQHSGTEPDVTSSVPVATSEGPKSAAGVLVGEHVSQLAQLQAASHPGGLPQADQPPSGGPAIASLQPANPPAVLNVISQAEVAPKKQSSTSAQGIRQLDSTSATPRSSGDNQASAAQAMHESEFLFSRTCCNALLIAYKLAEPAQCQRAVALLSVMTEVGGVLSPDILSYNSVVEALGAVGRAADALALLPVLRCADLQATVATLESLLAIAFRAGMMNEVVTMWHDITRCGMRANAVSFNKFLTALISLGRAHDAFEQYQTMLRHPQTLILTADTLSIVLVGCLDARNVPAALRVVHDATLRGLPLHLDALRKLVDLLQNFGLHDAAMHIRRILPDQPAR